jgi:hypothetical protein
MNNETSCSTVLYTPGPWFRDYIAGKVFNAKSNYVFSSDGKRTLAIVYGETEEEAYANAQLMADSPKLLEENNQLKESNRELVEALKEVAEKIGIDLKEPIHEFDATLHKKIKAAIKKASI